MLVAQNSLGSVCPVPLTVRGTKNGLQAADVPLPVQRTGDDVRGATRKSVVPLSARRLASSESMPGPMQPKLRQDGHLAQEDVSKAKKHRRTGSLYRFTGMANAEYEFVNSLIHRTRIVMIR